MKILHIAYGHRSDDTRIFKKECTSLAQRGFDVLYITSDKITKDTYDSQNVKRRIIPLRSNNRVIRVLKYMYDIMRIIKQEKPDVCHIHDFQIILLLILIPKRVKKIFDSHEDYPAYIADTVYRRLHYKSKYKMIEFIERFCFRKCNCIITATPYIRNQISQFSNNVIDVNNFPLVESYTNKKKYNKQQVCFTGGAGDSSGVHKVVEAIKNSSYKLVIAGNCSGDYLTRLKNIANDNIIYLGYLDKEGVSDLIETSLVGVVSYLPTADCIHAVPNKMFEYMERGIPIIYSNFPDWEEMIGKYNVGIPVDPNNSKQILNAIESFYTDETFRMTAGKNARFVIETVYNWKNEEKKLIETYENISLS